MYIRPAAIGMAPVLGVHASEKVRTLQYSILFSAVLSYLILSHHIYFLFFFIYSLGSIICYYVSCWTVF